MVALSLRDGVVLCLCIAVHLVYRVRKRRLLPLPPGPTRWPIIGSALSMTLSYAHIAYKRLGEDLGTKILYFEVLGQPIIVINDIQMAEDLLEKRSAIYSDRPQNKTFTKRNGLDKLFGLMKYGDEWRAHRRLFQQYFEPKRIDRQLERNERILRFVRRGLLPILLADPKDFREHFGSCVAGFALSITYGLPIQRQHDPRVQFLELVFREIAEASSPGKFFVYFLSSLCQDVPEWMPGAGFKRAARQLRLRIEELTDEPYQTLLELFNQGHAEESFVGANLEKSSPNADDAQDHMDRVKYTASQISGAATETTTTAVLTFVLSMLQHQDIQRKVQRELDSVIGLDRMPAMEDISHLPYLSAVIRETLRWNPIAPLGLPHMTTSEDVYNGYYIPKGSVILTNLYTMLYDEDVYPEPSKFDPGRFIEGGVLRDDVPNPELVASFGFGRRICPGAHIALPFIYLIAASVLHLFDISPEVDEKGNPVQVIPKFAPSSVTSMPDPFPCQITPRKDKIVTSLLKEYIDDGPI